MPLQIRMRDSTDGRMYSPARDYAHVFPELMLKVADRIERGLPTALQRMCDASGVTIEQVAAATVKTFEFMMAAPKRNDNDSMDSVLKSVGWYEVPEEAKMVMCAVLGQLTVGCFYTAARDVSLGEFSGLSKEADFVKRAQEFVEAVSRPAPDPNAAPDAVS